MITCLIQSIFSTQPLILEYVLVLNNLCQRHGLTVMYKELLASEGPHHDDTWTLTVYGITSYLHAILISNLPACSGSDRVR